MKTRIRRGIAAPPATQRTARRRACSREERELAALAQIDALLNESRVYVAVRYGARAAIDIVWGQGTHRAPLAVADPDWGTRNDGTLRLADAMLADALGLPVDEEMAQAFAAEVLRRVPDGGFAISAVDVRGWVVFHRAVQVPDGWM
ncbi:MAG TPA: DUF6166 domain-containing protein [Baekduia sp.]